MSGFDVIATNDGWRVLDGDVIVEVTDPHRDRGVVRAVLTVTDTVSIRYRDTVNLTSEQARAKTVAKLAKQGVTLDARILIALDQACRAPRPRSEAQARDDRSVVPEATPVDLAGLLAAFSRWLLIDDIDFLVILVGAILAHHLGGDPVWLLIVGPPGSTKSEVLRALYGSPGIFPLSELTARTFASGLDADHGDPSLLTRLIDEILVLKDFTTVLEMSREERQAILAQLREIYDGRFDKVWGTGKEVHWEGRLGLVAGVTPIIDRHQAVMAVLGERFVQVRPIMADRHKLARAALDTAGKEAVMREELATAMHGFLGARRIERPSVDPSSLNTLATVADFVTRARSGVVRNGSSRELEYAPEPEAPTRFAKVLLALASGIAIAHDDHVVQQRHLRLVLRVALDSVPVVRQRVISRLVQGPISIGTRGETSLTSLDGAPQFSSTTIRRVLEDLEALGLVTRYKEGKADCWDLDARWVEVFTMLTGAHGVRDGGSDISGKIPPSVPQLSARRQMTAVNGASDGCRSA